MTAKKDKPAKRGRKAAPADQRTEPFTVRLTPKIRYGIELLSRAQKGRSLSQVVEWAIQRGMNSVRLGQIGSLGEVLDEVWPKGHEWKRIKYLFQTAPELLEFVEKAICETLLGSDEYQALHQEFMEVRKQEDSKHSPPLSNPYISSNALFERYNAVFDQFVIENWDELKALISDRDFQGKPSDDVSIMVLLDLADNVQRIADLEALLDRPIEVIEHPSDSA